MSHAKISLPMLFVGAIRVRQALQSHEQHLLTRKILSLIRSQKFMESKSNSQSVQLFLCFESEKRQYFFIAKGVNGPMSPPQLGHFPPQNSTINQPNSIVTSQEEDASSEILSLRS
jgi:hypothetical protein